MPECAMQVGEGEASDLVHRLLESLEGWAPSEHVPTGAHHDDVHCKCEVTRRLLFKQACTAPFARGL